MNPPQSRPLVRAAKRAALHLIKANIEVLKAIEAVVIELRREEEPPADGPTRITVE